MDDDLEIPFIFVPHGAPEPTEWMALHPGWVKFPAIFVPHGASREPAPAEPPMLEPAVARYPAIAADPDALATDVAATDLEVSLAVAVALLAAAALLPKESGRRKSFAPVPRWSPLTGNPGVAAPPPEGMTAHPPSRPQPGHAPPSPGPKPGEGGLAPASPPEQHPDRPVTPNSAVILPGRDATAEGATIFQQQRNPDLEPALRPNVPRARAAAALAIPETAETLDPSEWSSHHLIGIANIRRYRELFEAAAKAGWTADEVENMAALPNSPEAPQKLKDRGINLPIHRGSHPDTSRMVDRRLDIIEQEMEASGLTEQSTQFQARARALIEDLQQDLRRDMAQQDRISFLQDRPNMRHA